MLELIARGEVKAKMPEPSGRQKGSRNKRTQAREARRFQSSTASRRQRCCNGLDRGGCWRPLEPGLPERVTVTIRTGVGAQRVHSRSRRAGQHSVDNAHDGRLKRFEILTLFAAEEPKSNKVVRRAPRLTQQRHTPL